MDDGVISFITCVNNDNLYHMCVSHIQSLTVPQGLRIELVRVSGSVSMTAGYNLGMSRAHGQYKVYLHQDVFILNTNLISDIMYIFNRFPDVGLMGLCGVETVPESGIWWEGQPKFGQVLEFRNKYQFLGFEPFSSPVREVAAVDGLFMATRVDLPWNEEIPGFHLYDTSHALDYRAAKWKLVIPYQQIPWALHYCGTDWDIPSYQHSLERFRQLYADQLLNPKDNC